MEQVRVIKVNNDTQGGNCCIVVAENKSIETVNSAVGTEMRFPRDAKVGIIVVAKDSAKVGVGDILEGDFASVAFVDERGKTYRFEAHKVVSKANQVAGDAIEQSESAAEKVAAIEAGL